MTIQPFLDQAVSRYQEGAIRGVYNVFRNYDKSYLNIINQQDLPKGTDLTDLNYDYTWTDTNQTLTITAFDTNIDLQKSIIRITCFTSRVNNAIIKARPKMVQPTNVNIIEFEFVVIRGVFADFDNIYIQFNQLATVSGGGTGTLDPRTNGLEQFGLTTFNITTTQSGTTTPTVSVTGVTATGNELGDFSATYSLPSGYSDTITSATVVGIKPFRTFTYTGADFIPNSQYYYRQNYNICVGTTPPTISASSGGTGMGCASGGSSARIYSTLPVDETTFSKNNNMVSSLSAGSARDFRSPYAGVWTPNITSVHRTEKWTEGGSPTLTQSPIWNARWSCTTTNGTDGTWLGLSQAEVDAIADKIRICFGLLNFPNSSSATLVDSGYGFTYNSIYESSLCYIIGASNGIQPTQNRGCTFAFSGTNNNILTISPDPLIIPDPDNALFYYGINRPTNYPVGFLIFTSVTSSSILIQQSTIPANSITWPNESIFTVKDFTPQYIINIMNHNNQGYITP
jgi:hypothetical protein